MVSGFKRELAYPPALEDGIVICEEHYPRAFRVPALTGVQPADLHISRYHLLPRAQAEKGFSLLGNTFFDDLAARIIYASQGCREWVGLSYLNLVSELGMELSEQQGPLQEEVFSSLRAAIAHARSPSGILGFTIHEMCAAEFLDQFPQPRDVALSLTDKSIRRIAGVQTRV